MTLMGLGHPLRRGGPDRALGPSLGPSVHPGDARAGREVPTSDGGVRRAPAPRVRWRPCSDEARPQPPTRRPPSSAHEPSGRQGPADTEAPRGREGPPPGGDGADDPQGGLQGASGSGQREERTHQMAALQGRRRAQPAAARPRPGPQVRPRPGRRAPLGGGVLPAVRAGDPGAVVHPDDQLEVARQHALAGARRADHRRLGRAGDAAAARPAQEPAGPADQGRRCPTR